jgi:hypothetical protein
VRKFNLKILLLLTFFLGILPAYATLDFEDHAFPEFITSARALAMGNAYINKVDDSWSSFYNPAGLGTVRGPQLHLANVHMEASSGLMDIVGDGPAYAIPGKYINSYDMAELRTELAENQGKIAHSRFNIFPNFTVRGLTLGYLYTQRNRAIINNDTANEFEIAERLDQGPVMSLSGSLFGGVFKLGATAVYLSRRDLYKSFGPTEVVDIAGSDYKKGSSLQLTLGTRLTLPFTFLPTFSAVLRNATQNDFENTSAGGSPDKIPQTVDLAFSITPQIAQTSRLHLEVNLRDLGDSYNTDYSRRMAAGAEIDFKRRIFIRGGWGDGWGSGGIGVRSRSFVLDLTTYAVDRSQSGFREEEDRRWVISIASGL